MLTIYLFDFLFLFPLIIILISGWFYFFKLNQAIVLIKPTFKDLRKIKTNVLKKINYSIFIKYILFLIFLFIIFLFSYKGYCDTFFFDHLFINLVNYKLLIFFYFMSLFILYIFYLTSFNKLLINIDFFFAIFNIIFLLPLIFLSNTFFTFFFFIEISSCLIFYKFINSRFFYKNINNNFKNFEKLNRTLPKNYLNILFFQYWVSFFSSALLLIFLIQFINIFSSSEWIFVTLLHNIFNNLNIADTYLIYIILIIFTIGFFFKIGITPIHLFKIEIYKGLPFYSIFFYTVFYFFIYFILFLFLTTIFLKTFQLYFFFIILTFVFFGLFFLISLLFDINLIKTFFAYSTIINTLVFLNIIIAILF